MIGIYAVEQCSQSYRGPRRTACDIERALSEPVSSMKQLSYDTRDQRMRYFVDNCIVSPLSHPNDCTYDLN